MLFEILFGAVCIYLGYRFMQSGLNAIVNAFDRKKGD